MTKKKKIIFITGAVLLAAALIALAAALPFLLPLTILRENHPDDARRIALEQFGLDEVWIVAAGTSGSTLTTQKTPNYPIYVLGEKDGEEHFIIVPQLKDFEPYEIGWVFEKSFREIVDELNAHAGTAICQKENYGEFEFWDNEEQIAEYAQGIPLDFEFMMVYREYLIVQSRQELTILSKV